MSIKFKSKLSEIEVDGKIVQNKHRVIKHTDTVQDLVVAVITKTVAHPEYGNGSASGFTIDEVEGAYLEFTQGITYKFDQSDSTNSGHPLLFYYESDKTTLYSAGVTTSGTPGTSGAYTQIVVDETTPAVLYYQCSAHSLMGSYVKFGTRNLTGFSISADVAEAIHLEVKNTSGSTINKGTPVYITGNVGNSNRLEIAPADASDAAKMPAVGLLETTLANNAEGFVAKGGYLKELATATIDGTSTSPNDTVYVKAGGGLTMTKPTGTNYIQNIAKVARVHASNGSLIVSSILRANDVPNIAENNIWLGNASGVPTPTVHNISNISDVNITNLADNQILKYDSSTSKWVNEADLSGSGASNSFETISVDGQSDVVAESSTDTLTLVAGDNITLTTDASADSITIASTGGGSGSDTGTVTIEKDVFDGSHATDPTDGSNTTFGLTSAPAGINNLQVYIDGVYQAKENYSLSGSTLTISPAPPSGVELEVIHIKAITGQITLDKFDGDNSTTAFTMSQSINNENNLQVYINGVYQSKDTYSTSGSTLTLTTAPATGAKVEVVHIKPVDVTSLSSEVFTGDGNQTAYDLTATPSAAAKTLVFIQGVYQEKSTYSISGNTITFTTAPPNGYTIEVTVFGRLAVSENTVNVERFTGDSSTTNFSLSNSPSANNLDVYVSGLYQNKNSYTYSAGTITFDEAPDTGAVVEAKYIANITQVVAADNDFYKFQWVTTVQTADFTAVANRGYFVNTTSAAITVTLPSSPTAGDEVSIVDYAGTADTNNITITSSDNINGSSNDASIDYERGGVSIVYVDATQGWIAYNATNETATALAPSLTVDYLVVAGGGGGHLAGGGAGGYLTDTNVSLLPNTQYTVTVGGGGAGASSYSSAGANGFNSIFNSITSTGGGRGGQNFSTEGADGGSGGGGAAFADSGNGGLGTSGQGNNGGLGVYTASSGGFYGSGGGGGAGAPGGDGNTSTLTSGSGGNGLQSNITGTSTYYAGGGGGGVHGDQTGYTSGTGGAGGGGNGAAQPSSSGGAAGSNGTPNTGGGGGGGSSLVTTAGFAGGSGGSGIVIIRYSDQFTIDIGAGLTGTTATDGSDRVTTFTAGTGNISFS